MRLMLNRSPGVRHVDAIASLIYLGLHVDMSCACFEHESSFLLHAARREMDFPYTNRTYCSQFTAIPPPVKATNDVSHQH